MVICYFTEIQVTLTLTWSNRQYTSSNVNKTMEVSIASIDTKLKKVDNRVGR